MTQDVVNVISIDVEEYFHALNLRAACPEAKWEELPSRVHVGTEAFLDLLAKHKVKGTFFILGWVADRYPELIRNIASGGHEIASHGYSHKPVWELDREAMREEIVQTRKSLSELAGNDVQGFRASTFSIKSDSLWVLDELIEAGYTYDSSIFPVRHDRYGIPDFPTRPVRIARGGGEILELPPLTRTVLSNNLPAGGGGYLRILPLSFHLQAIKKVNAQGHPAMIYLHPWELDPGQPRFRVGKWKEFRHYFNLKGTVGRLDRFLSYFPFGTAADVAEKVRSGSPQWDEATLESVA